MRVVVAKFGGGLMDPSGERIPSILQRIREMGREGDVRVLAIFSAFKGFTDRLQRIGEEKASSGKASIKEIFDIYRGLAGRFLREGERRLFLEELSQYEVEAEETLATVNRRFSGRPKARLLTSGGELPVSAIMDYALRSLGIDAEHLTKERWPIITDDNFEDATPIYRLSMGRIAPLKELLEEGKTVVLAGFLGMTTDGLETILGRGGSDQSAVFISHLLKAFYDVETILFKETPVLSADPRILKDQNPRYVHRLTYDEAIRASSMGMKIVQNHAVKRAQSYGLAMKVAALEDPGHFTMIQERDEGYELVKCIAGKRNCALLTMDGEASRYLENILKVWGKYEDFIDLGAEVLDAGRVVRNFLILDEGFVKKHLGRLRVFGERVEVEYGLGAVTLIGDRVTDFPEVISMALEALSNIGVKVKKSALTPHSSQIILVIDRDRVEEAIRAVHSKIDEMNERL